MRDYGYTSKQWAEDVTIKDKILMIAKRHLENEKDERLNNKISENYNKGRR